MEESQQDTVKKSRSGRIISMDQFRGYAIFGMIFVNWVNEFNIVPWMLHHHREGMSFNDTIAPIFIFVVGMGLRLSFLRRIAADGLSATRRSVIKRYLKLIAIGVLIYFGYWWDAFTDIGFGALLALPFIQMGSAPRILAAFVYLGLYQAAFSLTGYGPWVMTEACNGGPLGPLSWAFILLMGTLGHDLLQTRQSRKILTGCLLWGLGLVAAGWALKLPWPGLKPEWPFTQYGMSAPYPLYSTGLCFLTLLLFHVLCDVARIELPHLTTLGKNPLVIYLLHHVLLLVLHTLLGNDAGWIAIVPGFLFVYGVCYTAAWIMNRRGVIVKL